MPPFHEGELEFDFGNAQVTRLDEQGVPLPSGMNLVDFVVEQRTRVWLIEVKDPSAGPVPLNERARFAVDFKSVVDGNLTPKARDSYCFLHLMADDRKPMTFVVVIGEEAMPDRAFLLPMQDRLRRRLVQETNRPWVRKYVVDGVILTIESFSRHMRPFRVHRRQAV